MNLPIVFSVLIEFTIAGGLTISMEKMYGKIFIGIF